MIDTLRTEYAPTSVSAPGETLRELLEERGISQSDLAARMGRPQKTMSEIMNGKAAITPETALQLELVLGVPADFWNARERTYRAWLARLEEEERLQSLHQWCRRFPVKEMQTLGWIGAGDSTLDRARELLSFFGVAAPEQWQDVFQQYEVAFRRPARFSVDEPHLSAWLRRGAIQAERTQTGTYERDAFVEALRSVRALTRDTPRIFQPALRAACARVGVVVAFVPELPRSRASGATRWIGNKALIQLSLRYKTNDHLWFTFFHEAAHILLHGKRLIFIESLTGSATSEEDEANRWAADFLIPKAAYREFVDAGDFANAAISTFAKRVNIAAGIVVGRLQFDGLLPFATGNSLKARLQWAPTSPSA